MAYLLDTNILIRLVYRADPHHLMVRAALYQLKQRGEIGYYTSQNLVEFWNVCTRPTTARGGVGLSLRETDAAARLIERLFVLLPDSPAIHTEWRRLVVAHSVSGVQVHDARLVAAMNVHGITQILTLNDSDFTRYQNIITVHPQKV
ncbi:MAG: type II toxin-antitoxin system VapC family toxin [Abitibacteriaceae bacterium]|nr:type II toxin-antitoxin system VapC family toxin [Abditibacteriaceae bacterium]MBV9866895.1 type II toxin-antitoxin system VapC family toxin [Abditibacteriaceae bacterium]